MVHKWNTVRFWFEIHFLTKYVVSVGPFCLCVLTSVFQRFCCWWGKPAGFSWMFLYRETERLVSTADLLSLWQTCTLNLHIISSLSLLYLYQCCSTSVAQRQQGVLEEVFRSFTELKVLIPHCENTLRQVK